MVKTLTLDSVAQVPDLTLANVTEVPEPLRRALAPAEPYPLDALGDVLAPMARKLRAIIQAPDAICGQSVLAAAALAVQGHADVVNDGRIHPLVLFLLAIAESVSVGAAISIVSTR